MNSLPVIQNILFIDIETVPQYRTYTDVPARMKKLWDKKCENFKEDKMPYEFYDRAGIYSEFGKSSAFVADTSTTIRSIMKQNFMGMMRKQF